MNITTNIEQFQEGLGFDFEYNGQTWRGFINSENEREEIVANDLIKIELIELFDNYNSVKFRKPNKELRTCQIYKF